jgi:hypothetical protein
MRTFITILIIFFIINSGIVYSQEYLLRGTDSCKITNVDTQIKLDYKKYLVQIKDDYTHDRKLTIIIDKSSNDTLFVFASIHEFFKGIFENHMILDEGTGQIRDLRIYDLDKRELILYTDYIDDLKINGDKIIYT